MSDREGVERGRSLKKKKIKTQLAPCLKKADTC